MAIRTGTLWTSTVNKVKKKEKMATRKVVTALANSLLSLRLATGQDEEEADDQDDFSEHEDMYEEGEALSIADPFVQRYGREWTEQDVR
jgi:hypothetical protein